LSTPKLSRKEETLQNTTHNPTEANLKDIAIMQLEGINEGIVLKKIDSTFPVSDMASLQNPFWLKVKKVESHVSDFKR